MNCPPERKSRQRTKAPLFRTLLAFLGSALLTVHLASALNTSDPNLLQSRAIQTVELFKSNARRTGDVTSMLPAIRTARSDLAASYEAFVAKGDLGSAALSQFTMADIERLTTRSSSAGQNSAAEMYRLAIELSRQANRMDYEFKALVGLAQTESNQNDLTSASHHAAQALDLAQASGDKFFQFKALDELSEIEIKRKKLDAAHTYLERAQSLAITQPDSSELYLYYMDRGECQGRSKCMVRRFVASENRG